MYELQKPCQVENEHNFAEKKIYETAANVLTLYGQLSYASNSFEFVGQSSCFLLKDEKQHCEQSKQTKCFLNLGCIVKVMKKTQNSFGT